MKLPHGEALKSGVTKTFNVKDIKLSNDEKKTMKEGTVFDTFEDYDGSNVAVSMVNTVDVLKVSEQEAYSAYIFPPLKRSLRPTVRIISLVLLAVKKFKKKLILSKIRSSEAQIPDLEKLEESSFTSQ